MRVLIVEDNIAQAESLELLLKSLKCNVHVAYGVASAKIQAEAHTPDIVLLDWIVPGGGGAEFLAWLRGRDATKDTPVIISTGLEASDVSVLPLPKVRILEKPVDPELLINILSEYGTKSWVRGMSLS